MWKQKIKENKGSTLAELLMTVLIIALIGSILGGGLMVVQRCYRQITERSHAATLLSSTATLLADQLEYATDLSIDGDSISFLNANSKVRARISWTEAEGIILSYQGGGAEENGASASEETRTVGGKTALVSEAGLTDALYTSFDSIRYERQKDGRALITIQGLGVYRKSATEDSASVTDDAAAAGEAKGESLAKTDLEIRIVNRLQAE